MMEKEPTTTTTLQKVIEKLIKMMQSKTSKQAQK